MEEYERVKNWLISSGLCVQDKSDPNVGAVHSFYDTKKNEFGFLYPEITGYYLSTMKFLYNQEESDKYLEIAKLCGKWLSSIYDRYGGIVMGVGSEQRMLDQIFSFDTSICAKGFLDLYEISGDEQCKQYAKKMLDWLVSKCVEEDGTIKPVMNRKSQQFMETPMWYAQKGCFGIKLAIPFLQYEEPRFKEAARHLTDFILTLQATEENPKMNGGFYEEFYKSVLGWKKQSRINSWTSMFALQAINWIENYNTASFENSIKYLY